MEGITNKMASHISKSVIRYGKDEWRIYFTKGWYWLDQQGYLYDGSLFKICKRQCYV